MRNFTCFVEHEIETTRSLMFTLKYREINKEIIRGKSFSHSTELTYMLFQNDTELLYM